RNSATGEDEDSVARVRCTDGGSGKTDPLRVIPEVGQVSQNCSCCPKRSSCGFSQMPRVAFHTARGSGFWVCMFGVALLILVSFVACADCVCGEQSADVLNHNPLGLQYVDRRCHVRPQAG